VASETATKDRPKADKVDKADKADKADPADKVAEQGKQAKPDKLGHGVSPAPGQARRLSGCLVLEDRPGTLPGVRRRGATG